MKSVFWAIAFMGVCFFQGNLWSLTGVVVEAALGQPVPGAAVAILGTTDTVFTDDQGQFTLDPGLSTLPGSGRPGWQPAVRGGQLYIRFPKNQPATLEIFSLGGLQVVTWKMQPNNIGFSKVVFPPVINHRTPGPVILRIASRTGANQFWTLVMLGGNSVLAVATASLPEPLKKRPSRAGVLTIAKEKLLTGQIAFADNDQDLGEITLDYPARQLDVGAPPPYSAVVLFDGKGTREAAVAEMAEKWGPWSTLDGQDDDATGITFTVVPDPEHLGDAGRWALMSCCSTNWGFDDLQAKEPHGDVQLHVEFNMLGEYDSYSNPDPNESQSKEEGNPGYTNSGVYVQSRYEIQIYSTDANDLLTDTHGMASIVDDKAPASDERRANGEWQAYDITFRSARYDAQGNRTENGYLTVYWNGVRVHNNVESTAPATGSDLQTHSGEEMTPELFGLKLQSEGRDCRYRNIWMKHLHIEAPETDFGY